MAYVTFKLGITGLEQSITFTKPAFRIAYKERIAESYNIQGDYRKTIFKVNVPVFSIDGTKMSITDYNLFTALKSRAAILNFLFRDDLAVPDEQNTSTDATHVTLVNTGASGITITGVYLLTDPTHAGTNYYTSGSYNATTRVITLGSALPGATTDVLIAYTYTGHSVRINSIGVAAMSGQQKNYYTVTMELEGA